MTQQNHTWQDRFDEYLGEDSNYYCGIQSEGLKIDELKSFITEELQRALQECLPEEKDEDDFPIPEGEDIGAYCHCESLKRKGSNACREQFIKNAKERGLIIE